MSIKDKLKSNWLKLLIIFLATVIITYQYQILCAIENSDRLNSLHHYDSFKEITEISEKVISIKNEVDNNQFIINSCFDNLIKNNRSINEQLSKIEFKSDLNSRNSSQPVTPPKFSDSISKHDLFEIEQRLTAIEKRLSAVQNKLGIGTLFP